MITLTIVGVVVGAVVGGGGAYFAAKARSKAIVEKADKEGEDVAGEGEVHSA